MKIDKAAFEEARVALDIECDFSKYEDCNNLAATLNKIMDFENAQGKRVINDTPCKISFKVLLDLDGEQYLEAGIDSRVNGKSVWSRFIGNVSYTHIGNEEDLISFLEYIYKESEKIDERVFPDELDEPF